MSYVDQVIEEVIAKNPAEPEFHQAVREVLETLCVLDERLTWRTGHNQMITICIKH